MLRTARPSPDDLQAYQSQALAEPGREAGWAADGTGDLLLPCAWASAPPQRSVLRVTTVQPPTKKALAAKDFRNGLRKKRLVLHVPPAGGAAAAAAAAVAASAAAGGAP